MPRVKSSEAAIKMKEGMILLAEGEAVKIDMVLWRGDKVNKLAHLRLVGNLEGSISVCRKHARKTSTYAGKEL
jgi:hypothetical protein